MLKKLLNKLEKLSIRQLTILSLISFALLILECAAYICNILNLASTMLFVILTAFLLGPSIGTLVLRTECNARIKEQEETFERLKAELSYSDFTKVYFEPINSSSRNIQRCLRIQKNLKLTDFAKISNDNNIIVIAKDADGRECDRETMDVERFDRNYKVLK